MRPCIPSRSPIGSKTAADPRGRVGLVGVLNEGLPGQRKEACLTVQVVKPSFDIVPDGVELHALSRRVAPPPFVVDRNLTASGIEGL